MRSEYQRLLSELESKKCGACDGLGTFNDSDPYDISFKEWTCNKCLGTGLRPRTETNLPDHVVTCEV